MKKPGIAARFIAHALSADLVQPVSDDLAAAAAARDEVETDRESGVASTATVGKLIAGGMKEVNYLDAIRHNQYSRAPERLRTWQSASHIERAPQREKKQQPSAAPAK